MKAQFRNVSWSFDGCCGGLGDDGWQKKGVEFFFDTVQCLWCCHGQLSN